VVRSKLAPQTCLNWVESVASVLPRGRVPSVFNVQRGSVSEWLIFGRYACSTNLQLPRHKSCTAKNHTSYTAATVSLYFVLRMSYPADSEKWNDLEMSDKLDVDNLIRSASSAFSFFIPFYCMEQSCVYPYEPRNRNAN
jgi:hypothetical protein